MRTEKDLKWEDRRFGGISIYKTKRWNLSNPGNTGNIDSAGFSV